MTAADSTSAGRKPSPRARLPLHDNPRPSREYIVGMKTVLMLTQGAQDAATELSIHIRYVPDRLICDSAQMTEYFNSLARLSKDGLEEMANAIADEFNNELIPRWISVKLSLSVDGVLQSAHVEDKQPLWDNPGLLQRLA